MVANIFWIESALNTSIIESWFVVVASKYSKFATFSLNYDIVPHSGDEI
jgi:hypothetical protein